MTKGGKRYCDNCKAQMQPLNFSDESIIPYDRLSLGYKNKNQVVMSKNLDLCQDCMSKVINALEVTV